MSKSNPLRAAYRHYKPKDLGVVRLSGKDYYLGKFDSPESWEKYHRLIAEWLSNPDFIAGPEKEPSEQPRSVNEVILAYVTFARDYYVADGEPTSEVNAICASMVPLRTLYGRSPACQFGPKALKNVRQHMIDVMQLCRKEVNKRVGRIKRAFGWAASEELIPASVWHGLQTVTGLRKGRTRAERRNR